jgi:hypothetical protein
LISPLLGEANPVRQMPCQMLAIVCPSSLGSTTGLSLADETDIEIDS